MKLVLRIFNIVIMALASVATIFLFAAPTMSFNSNIAFDVKKLSEFIPTTEYTEGMDLARSLGTDSVHVGISFTVKMGDMSLVVSGDKEKINSLFIDKNIDGVVDTLTEPVELIAEHTIKSIMQNLMYKNVYELVDQARAEYSSPSTTEEIMDEAGMDYNYFSSIATLVYAKADTGTATPEELGDVLIAQIDEALAKVDDSGIISSTAYDETTKNEIRAKLNDTLASLNMVEGGHVKKISEYYKDYFIDFLKTQLSPKVSDPSELDQRIGELKDDYMKRLLKMYVSFMLPNAFYQMIGYVCLGLMIGLYVFTAIWVILIVITLFRTLNKNKPWTIFGPWFWIIGGLQLVLGLGLTIAFKFVLPNTLNIASFGIPISSAILVPRTYALVPSILYLVCLVIAIAYIFIKHAAKAEMKLEGK